MACSVASSGSAQIHAYTYAWTHTHTHTQKAPELATRNYVLKVVLFLHPHDEHNWQSILRLAAGRDVGVWATPSVLATPAASSYNITIKYAQRNFAMFCVGCVKKYMIKCLYICICIYTFTYIHNIIVAHLLCKRCCRARILISFTRRQLQFLPR